VTVGYLPAEHIETPTERLARLNKHRNIDVSSLEHDSLFCNSDNSQLSATMLGDTTEKSKNYLKNAMRRRNAKKVQFGGQSYVEASEHEYSSDEEDGDKVYTNGEGSSSDESLFTADGNTDCREEAEMGHANNGKGPTSNDTNGNASAQEQKDDEDIVVAPLKVRVAKDRRSPSPEKKSTSEDDDEDLRRQGVDQSRQSDDSFERQGRAKLRKIISLEELKLRLFSGPSRSRLGTIRNTDSFFKDEGTETRKITLTPGLLRDDGAVVRSIDGKERGGSFEILDTGKTSFDKARDDKKKKDKKPGMLSGLFKKKDKKPKDGKEIPSPQKQSEELSRDSPSTESEDQSPTATPNNLTPQRKPSNGKLHKTPPGASPVSPSSPTALSGGLRPLVLPSEQAQRESQATTVVGSDSTTPRSVSPQASASTTSQEKPTLRLMTTEASADPTGDYTNKMRSPSDQPREKVKKAAIRQALDVDSSPEAENGTNPFADPEGEAQKQTARTEDSAGSLSESPVHITSADAVPDNEPPALVGDTTSNSSADELASLRSSPSPQQNIAGAAAGSTSHPASAPLLSPHSATNDSHSPTSPHSPQQRGQGSPLPPPSRSPPPQPQRTSPLPPTPTSRKNTSSPPLLSPSTAARNNSAASTSSGPATLSRTPSNGASAAAAAAAWNDASLRAYLDEGCFRDTKELLQVVYDTSGVVPVAADHPLIADLFHEERKAVREMGAELDGLLMGWLGRKRIAAAVMPAASGPRAV